MTAPTVLVAAALMVLPMWKVHDVRITGGEIVPAAASTSVRSLIGHGVLLLDLDWVRLIAASWPAAGDVRVRLELPGTLVMEIMPETVHGSTMIGCGWHAVAADGRLAGTVASPVPPRLEGFTRPADRRSAFAVARRLTEASGAVVDEIRKVTPGDYGVGLNFDGGDRTVQVHVAPDGTEAERAWCRAARDHVPNAGWADLRGEVRIVLRNEGREAPMVEAGS